VALESAVFYTSFDILLEHKNVNDIPFQNSCVIERILKAKKSPHLRCQMQNPKVTTILDLMILKELDWPI